MSELLSKQSGNQLPSELRKKFSEVQHVKETGRIAIYGVDKKTKKKTRLGTKEFVKSYGHDPEPQQAWGIWRSDGEDIAVTVTGKYGNDEGGAGVYKAKGIKQKIPANEISWMDSAATSGSDRLKKLEDRISDLVESHRQLHNKFEKQEEENRRLREENTRLKRHVEKLTAGDVAIRTETQDKRSESKAMSYFNRGAGWVGSKMPWRGEPSYQSRRLEESEDGPVVVMTEETVDGYPVEDRRRGISLALGVLAATGVAVLAAGLWGEHEERETRVQTPPHVRHDVTAGEGQRHEALFHGDKAFKVSLPGNLKWKSNDDGSYRIEDMEDHDIVPHVYWDQQGNLDVDSMQLLRTTPYHNFQLKQAVYRYHTPGTTYDHHYETVIENQ